MEGLYSTYARNMLRTLISGSQPHLPLSFNQQNILRERLAQNNDDFSKFCDQPDPDELVHDVITLKRSSDRSLRAQTTALVAQILPERRGRQLVQDDEKRDAVTELGKSSYRKLLFADLPHSLILLSRISAVVENSTQYPIKIGTTKPLPSTPRRRCTYP